MNQNKCNACEAYINEGVAKSCLYHNNEYKQELQFDLDRESENEAMLEEADRQAELIITHQAD